jgi:SAM-dependent methyltransferase
MSIRNRISFVNELAARQKEKLPDSRFLEIGPYMSPILNKDEADYFDVLDKDALVERSKLEGTPYWLVANVDFVGPEASDKYIPEKYSLIVSSHVVEHQIDLIKHLNQVHDLLVPGGLYVALIPDLRYCFDHFLNPSTVVDAIAAHFSVSSNHTLNSFLDDRLLTSHNNPLDYWRGKNGKMKIAAVNFAIASIYKGLQSAKENFAVRTEN